MVMKLIVAGVSIVLVADCGACDAGAVRRRPCQVDHLVYTTPDLELGIQAIEKLTGVRASAGGQHPGLARGTRSSHSIVDIPGRSSTRSGPAGAARARRFGIDGLKAPRLLTWVAKGTDLAPFVDRARGNGVRLVTSWPAVAGGPMASFLVRYTDPDVIWRSASFRTSLTGERRRIPRRPPHPVSR